MQITRRLVSRRNVLTGIAAAPTLAVAGAPIGVLAEEVDATAARAKAALKDAKGTKLVLLGTGSGPIPGLSRGMASSLMVHSGAAYIIHEKMRQAGHIKRVGDNDSFEPHLLLEQVRNDTGGDRRHVVGI